MPDSLPLVHVFVCSGRFASREALQAYLAPAYTDDGDALPSPFCVETGLTCYEPACLESAMLAPAAPLAQLLDGVSYGASWLAQACADAQGMLADTAVCVFAPNQLAHPQRSSLRHVGSYPYRVDDCAPSPRASCNSLLTAASRLVPEVVMKRAPAASASMP